MTNRELLIDYELRIWINPTKEMIKIAEKYVDSYLLDNGIKNKNSDLANVIKSVCDKIKCEHYNSLYERCKYLNSYCALKK